MGDLSIVTLTAFVICSEKTSLSLSLSLSVSLCVCVLASEHLSQVFFLPVDKWRCPPLGHRVQIPQIPISLICLFM